MGAWSPPPRRPGSSSSPTPTGSRRSTGTGRAGTSRCPRPTIRAVLTALGIEAEGDDAIEQALADVDLATWRRTLPATVVAREGWTPWVHAHVPAGTGIRLEVVLEDGSVREVPQVDRWVEDRDVDGEPVGEATFEVPGDLPVGWHRLVAHLDVPAVDPRTTESTLVVTPQRLELPPPWPRAGSSA